MHNKINILWCLNNPRDFLKWLIIVETVWIIFRRLKSWERALMALYIKPKTCLQGRWWHWRKLDLTRNLFFRNSISTCTAVTTALTPVSNYAKERIAVNGTPVLQLRDVTCHNGITQCYRVEYTYGTPMSVLPSFAERKLTYQVTYQVRPHLHWRQRRWGHQAKRTDGPWRSPSSSFWSCQGDFWRC